MHSWFGWQPQAGLTSILSLRGAVNVYYVMGFRPIYFTCIAHLYLYYTLLVPHTYTSYIRHWCIFSYYEIQYKSSSISNNRVAYQDVPPLFVMTSNNILVLIPNRAPNAIASALEALWTPACNWLSIFTLLQNQQKKVRNNNWRPQHNQITVPHENE